ncbi:MAG: ABC transporter substrate-binding protein [Clostridiales bacterium]|nr:ABC transporter substrate-binding protein [Clostridiales bacterium]
MKVKSAAMFMTVLVGSSIILGCGNSGLQDSADIDNTSSVASGEDDFREEEAISDDTVSISGDYYTVLESSNIQDTAKELAKIDVPDDTLVVGVDVDYSEQVVEELNQLLRNGGYDFGVLFCRIPDDCMLDGAVIDFAQYLSDSKVQLDIIPLWNTFLPDMVKAGMLADLTDRLIDEEALLASYPEKFWELTAVDGRNYGAGMFNLSQGCWAVNADLMEKYGFSEEDLSTDITDMGDIFETVCEGESDLDFSAFAYEPRIFLESLPFYFVDGNVPIGYWIDGDNSEAVNLFDTERMKELVGTMNDYYQKGYVDISSDPVSGTAFFMQPDYDGFTITRSDSLDTWTNEAGISLVRIPWYQQSAANLSYEINGITSWSIKQDEAWDFLTFVYENKDASDLLLYGIEGEDYSISDGTVTAGSGLTEDIIGNRSLGNRYIATVISPYEDDSKQELMENELNSLSDSDLAGFVFDQEPVQSEVYAVSGLYMELSTFRRMFAFTPDRDYKTWEEYYDAFEQQLEDAGIDDIVDEMNWQIQEYLKNS